MACLRLQSQDESLDSQGTCHFFLIPLEWPPGAQPTPSPDAKGTLLLSLWRPPEWKQKQVELTLAIQEESESSERPCRLRPPCSSRQRLQAPGSRPVPRSELWAAGRGCGE